MTPEENISYLSVTDLFAIDEQREAVKQSVDGESRLVNRQDDGAPVVCHPEKTLRSFTHFFFLCQLPEWLLRTRCALCMCVSTSSKVVALS